MREKTRNPNAEIRNKSLPAGRQAKFKTTEIRNSFDFAFCACFDILPASNEFDAWKSVHCYCREKPLRGSDFGFCACFGFRISCLFRILCFYLACSRKSATLRIVASSKCFPRICRPIGRPCLSVPHGMLTPAIPARFAEVV
jgi:hypothetical protein